MPAQTIAQRVVVEGAGEIERQFERLGQAGDSAFSRIAAAGRKLRGAFVDQFTKELAKMNKEAQEGSKKNQAAIANTRTAFGALTATFGEGGVRIGAAFGVIDARLAALGLTIGGLVTAFKGLTTGAVESGVAVMEGATAAGVSTKEYQELQYAFSQAGIGTDELNRIFATFNKTQSDAQEAAKKLSDQTNRLGLTVRRLGETGPRVLSFAEGFKAAEKPLFDTTTKVADLTKKAGDATKEADSLGKGFDLLGIKAKDIVGLNTVQMIQLVADRLRATENPATRAAAALDIFGKSGAKLQNVLGEGAAKLAAVMAEASRLGLVLTDEQLETVSKADDAFDKLAFAAARVKDQIGLAFAPFLTEQATAFTNWLIENRTYLIQLAEVAAGQLREAFNGTLQVARDFMAAISGQAGSAENTWIAVLVGEFAKLKQSFDDLKLTAGDVFRFIMGEITAFITGITNTVREITALVNAVRSVGRAIGDAFTAGREEAMTPGGFAEGHARGGFIRGPGTGTSDSIPAWLSAGEYVIPARIVRALGVGFFDRMIGGGGLTLKKGIPGFAAGGMVPALSAGPSGQPVVLNIAGETIRGLSATPDAVSQLMRFAAGQNMRSAGRKPSWA